jgi:hypothetical protein
MKYWRRLDIQDDEAHGFRVGYVVCEAIKIAVKGVGHENLDWAAVHKALSSMKDFAPYGIGRITLCPRGPQRLKFRKTISSTR